MTAKHTYYKIDCEDSQALGLSGSDKDVYFFIRSYKEGCTMRQQVMAQMLCMPERSLQRSLLSLVQRGLVSKYPSSVIVNGGFLMTYTITRRQIDATPGAKNAVPRRQIDATPGAKNAVPRRQIDATHNNICKTQSIDTKYNDTNVVDARRAREEELQKNGAVLPVDDLTEELRQEVLNGGTVSESANRLYGIGQEELLRYVGWFRDKLNMDSVSYKSRSDFRMHFQNWLRIRVKENMNQKQQNTNGTNNSSRKYQSKYSTEYMAGIVADITSGE